MDMEELRARAYSHDPQSLESLLDAARNLTFDYGRDSEPYKGGSMSAEAADLGRKIAAEYGLKALDIVTDLASAPMPATPSGLPSAEIAAQYLHGVSRTLVTRETCVRTLYRGPYEMPTYTCELLFDWLVLGGYLNEVKVNTATGQVDGVRSGAKPTPYERKLMDEPRWVSVTFAVDRHAPLSPLTGTRDLYAHPDVIARLFTR
ncbi:hypothetical protein ACIRPQ_28990 [Streptomyces sp. NPDC101213]|uniref:hypothetical protein n=1 Tax=Streptomyces sp. NPDC101213 TaxID=3366130 RepID=UPI0037FE92B4